MKTKCFYSSCMKQPKKIKREKDDGMHGIINLKNCLYLYAKTKYNWAGPAYCFIYHTKIKSKIIIYLIKIFSSKMHILHSLLKKK